MNGNNSIEKGLVAWIRSAKYDTNVSKGIPLKRLELVHYGGRKEDTLYSLDDITTETDENEAANTLLHHAERDAEGLGGTQSYGIYAYYGDGKRPAYKHRFRLSCVDPFGDAADIGSEPPTEKGITKQLMRHVEGMARINASSMGGIIAHYEKTIERLQKRVETLESRELESKEAYEELLSLKQTRDIEKLQAESKEKRIDDIVGTVKMLLPSVVNKLAGKEVVPGATDPVRIQVEAVVKTLKPEQLSKMMNVLEPQQAAALMTLISDTLPNAPKALTP